MTPAMFAAKMVAEAVRADAEGDTREAVYERGLRHGMAIAYRHAAELAGSLTVPAEVAHLTVVVP